MGEGLQGEGDQRCHQQQRHCQLPQSLSSSAQQPAEQCVDEGVVKEQAAALPASQLPFSSAKQPAGRVWGTSEDE